VMQILMTDSRRAGRPPEGGDAGRDIVYHFGIHPIGTQVRRCHSHTSCGTHVAVMTFDETIRRDV